MNKDLVAFTGTLVLLTIVTGLVTVQFANPSFLILILIVLAATTWLVYFFIQRANREDFIKNYLLTIVLKLLAGGVFIFALLYIDKRGADSNAILFMAAYLLFTGLEVVFLFRRMG
jgi:predicted neutral ceramidase superfamily lipid hydrolase